MPTNSGIMYSPLPGQQGGAALLVLPLQLGDLLGGLGGSLGAELLLKTRDGGRLSLQAGCQRLHRRLRTQSHNPGSQSSHRHPARQDSHRGFTVDWAQTLDLSAHIPEVGLAGADVTWKEAVSLLVLALAMLSSMLW